MKRASVVEMKRIIFFLLLAILGISEIDVCAQTNTTSPTYNSNGLCGTKWVEQHENQYKQWTLTFTDSMMTNTVVYHVPNEKTYPHPQLYYLADSVPQEFDMSKVGKNTSGRYVIGLFKDRLVYNEILGLTENVLKIRQTYHGDTLVFFRAKK